MIRVLVLAITASSCIADGPQGDDERPLGLRYTCHAVDLSERVVYTVCTIDLSGEPRHAFPCDCDVVCVQDSPANACVIPTPK